MRTIFNLLGPLTNPAHASAQVVGVYSVELVEKLAEALSMLGLHRALVVHGLDGLDEITITGPTRVAEVREGNVRTYAGTKSPRRDLVLLNAAAALVAAGKADHLGNALPLAVQSIDSGSATAKLEALVQFTTTYFT